MAVLAGNVDYTISFFLFFAALLVLVDSFAATYSHSVSLIPYLVVTLALASFIADYVRRLSASVRRRLWLAMSSRRLAREPTALATSALVLSFAAAIIPRGVSALIGTAAGVLATTALGFYGGRPGRPARFPPDRTTRLRNIDRFRRLTLGCGGLAALAAILALVQLPHVIGVIWTLLFLTIGAHMAVGARIRKRS
jgi:hypothetical protein